MNDEKWQEFDRRLEARVRQLPQAVEVSEESMGIHHDIRWSSVWVRQLPRWSRSGNERSVTTGSHLLQRQNVCMTCAWVTLYLTEQSRNPTTMVVTGPLIKYFPVSPDTFVLVDNWNPHTSPSSRFLTPLQVRHLTREECRLLVELLFVDQEHGGEVKF